MKFPAGPSIRKWLWRVLLAVVVLVTLSQIAILEEYFRTSRAWTNYRREAVARGVEFNPAAFAPPPVPDDKNMALTPFLKTILAPAAPSKSLSLAALQNQTSPADSFTRRLRSRDGPLSLYGWVGNDPSNPDLLKRHPGFHILAALKPFAPEMAEVTAAGKLPHAQLTTGFEGDLGTEPNLAALFDVAWLFYARAIGECSAGQTDAAVADLETLFRLADLLATAPSPTAQLIREAIYLRAAEAFSKGITNHAWTELQLAALQQRLEHQNLLADFQRSQQWERARFVAIFEGMAGTSGGRTPLRNPWSFAISFLPLRAQYFKACLHQNLLNLNREFDSYLAPAIDSTKHVIHPNVAGPLGGKRNPNPYNFLAVLVQSDLGPIIEGFGEDLVKIDTTIVACALERYWLAHGEYPTSLDSIIPRFLLDPPLDVFSGLPLGYATVGNSYILYAVGLNHVDDHGKYDDVVRKPPGQ